MLLNDSGIHLHQSDVESFRKCPESKRLDVINGLDAFGELFESDAATVGTGMHATIEYELAGNWQTDLFRLKEYASNWFMETMRTYAVSGVRYSRETFRTDLKAIASLEILVESWFKSEEREMLQHMDPADRLVEWQFDLPFTVDRNGRQIWLAGKADLVLPNEVWDWKSASGDYKPWEKQRWAIQPTTYLWAASESGLIRPNLDGEFKFRYKVAVRKSTAVKFQTVTVTRGEGQFDWLKKLTRNMSEYIESQGFQNEWLLRDESALCSGKWCSFWDQCKGSHVSPEWS